MAAPLENVTAGALIVVALALTFVAFRAWNHTRSRKVLLLAIAFSVFAVKGLVVGLGLFLTAEWEKEWFMPVLLLDLLILGIFYVSILRQSPA